MAGPGPSIKINKNTAMEMTMSEIAKIFNAVLSDIQNFQVRFPTQNPFCSGGIQRLHMNHVRFGPFHHNLDIQPRS